MAMAWLKWSSSDRPKGSLGGKAALCDREPPCRPSVTRCQRRTPAPAKRGPDGPSHSYPASFRQLGKAEIGVQLIRWGTESYGTSLPGRVCERLAPTPPDSTVGRLLGPDPARLPRRPWGARTLRLKPATSGVAGEAGCVAWKTRPASRSASHTGPMGSHKPR